MLDERKPPTPLAEADRATAHGTPNHVVTSGPTEAATTMAHGSRAVLPPLEPDLTQPMGRFKPIRVLGQGGYGVVYEAHDPRLDRRVALKIIRARGDALSEARALAKVQHPNVVAVYDAEAIGDDKVAIAMEFVEGASLRANIRRGPEHVRWDSLVSAAEGLAAVHKAGLIHGDVKPDNILIGEDGRARLGDFGLATMFGEATQGGTPGYLSPEHSETGGTMASDVLAMALVIVETVTGLRAGPVQDKADVTGELARLRSALNKPIASVTKANLRAFGAPVRRVLSRALDANAVVRPTARELADALRGRDSRSRRAWIATGILGAAAVSGGAVFALMPRSQDAAAACRASVDDVRAPAADVIAALDSQLRAKGPLGVSAAPIVDDALGRYQQGLSTRLDNACKQAEAVRAQSVSCLRTLNHGVTAALTRIGGLEGPQIEQAAQIALRATTFESCELEAQGRQPLPTEPATLAAVQALTVRLDATIEVANAGKLAESRDLIKTIVAEATPLGYHPLTAGAQLALGRVLANMGDPSAPELLRSALISAEQGRDTASVVRIRLLLSRLARKDEKAFGAAGEHLALAKAAAAGLGADFMRGDVLAQECRHLATLGKNLEATPLCVEAATWFEARGNRMATDAWTVGSVTASQRNDAATARDLANRALASAIRFDGEQSMAASQGREVLARAAHAEGNWQEMLTLGDAVLAQRQLVMPETYGVLAIQNTRAMALFGLGRDDDAFLALRDALRIGEKLGIADSDRILTTRMTLGRRLISVDAKEAELHLAKALEISVKAAGPDNLDARWLRVALARAVARQGDAVRTHALIEAALKDYPTEDPVDVAQTLLDATMAYNDVAPARTPPIIERVRDLLGADKGTAETRANAEWQLAQAQWRLGKKDQALATARAAEAVLATAPDSAAYLAELRAWIASPE